MLVFLLYTPPCTRQVASREYILDKETKEFTTRAAIVTVAGSPMKHTFSILLTLKVNLVNARNAS